MSSLYRAPIHLYGSRGDGLDDFVRTKDSSIIPRSALFTPANDYTRRSRGFFFLPFHLLPISVILRRLHAQLLNTRISYVSTRLFLLRLSRDARAPFTAIGYKNPFFVTNVVRRLDRRRSHLNSPPPPAFHNYRSRQLLVRLLIYI